MPKMVQVVGGFNMNGHPAQGLIRFTPTRLWVIEEGIAWACLCPTVQLDENGQFAVLLTPTDSDAVPWYYRVETHAGAWMIAPKGTSMLHLRDLVA